MNIVNVEVSDQFSCMTERLGLAVADFVLDSRFYPEALNTVPQQPSIL